MGAAPGSARIAGHPRLHFAPAQPGIDIFTPVPHAGSGFDVGGAGLALSPAPHAGQRYPQQPGYLFLIEKLHFAPLRQGAKTRRRGRALGENSGKWLKTKERKMFLRIAENSAAASELVGRPEAELERCLVARRRGGNRIPVQDLEMLAEALSDGLDVLLVLGPLAGLDLERPVQFLVAVPGRFEDRLRNPPLRFLKHALVFRHRPEQDPRLVWLPVALVLKPELGVVHCGVLVAALHVDPFIAQENDGDIFVPR